MNIFHKEASKSGKFDTESGLAVNHLYNANEYTMRNRTMMPMIGSVLTIVVKKRLAWKNTVRLITISIKGLIKADNTG